MDLKIDDIVTGDYVLLQAGDKVCADGIIVNGDIKGQPGQPER